MMKAVVLERPGTLTYQEVEQPQPGVGQALVRMQAASICGSDLLRVFHGHARVLPIILGHECAGIIEAVGAGVDSALVGQPAAIIPLVPCMKCDPCGRGLYASCRNYSFIGSRVAGGFAEYVALPAQNLLLLPLGIDLELAALIEPLSVGAHALARGGGAAGRTVGVVGVGSIGLLATLMAHYKGARSIIAIDVDDARLETAKAFGASAVFNARSGDVVEAARALTGGGVDLALEVSGVPSAAEQAVMLARPGGDAVFVGNQPMDKMLPTSLIEHIMRYQINLHGAWMSYSAPFPGQEWQDAAAVVAQEGERLKAIISHRVTLGDVPGIFAQIHDGTLAYRKVLISPEQRNQTNRDG
jgi:L-iditol 2-dehydrogenase